MATGDLKNNLRKFHTELRLINYVCDLDIEGLSIGRPSAFLPVLHFVLTEYSVELAQYFYSKDYEVLGKNDKNFLSVIYRIVRDEFDTKPPLTKEQFFTIGFAERKLQFATSLIQLCRKKGEGMRPKKKKNAFSSSTAKSSKNSIPVGTANTTLGTRNSTGSTNFQATSLGTMPMKSSALHFSKPLKDKTAVVKENNRCARPVSSQAYKSDNQLSDGQKLRNDLDLTMPDDEYVSNDQNDALRPRIVRACYAQTVDKNIANNSVLPVPEKSTKINPLLQQETYWNSSGEESPSKGCQNAFVAKENICPNLGSGLLEGYNNIHYHSKSGQLQTSMLSPIPLTNKASIMSFHPQSKKFMRNDCLRANDTAFVPCSVQAECSKQIFVTQPRESERNPLGNESRGISLVDRHSPEVAEILDLVRAQDKKINVLEKEAEKQTNRIKEMMETNSKLNARVIVLETAVALIQEKTES